MNTSLKELFDLGLHFGHLKSYSHPKSKQFIYTISDGVSIIDLEKTKEKLEEAMEFVKNLSKENKTILFIGTKRQAASAIKEQATKIGMPYIDKRFMGGTLTNFETILKSIKKLEGLKEKLKDNNALTKKEQGQLMREKKRLEDVLEGLSGLTKLPDVVFIVDVTREKNAVFEANRLGIPIIAIIDTNGDPSLIDYPIPANDNTRRGVEFLLGKIAESYAGRRGKKK